MSTLSRSISDKQTMLFDKDTRTLYVIDGSALYKSAAEVEPLVARGAAMKFDKTQLQSLQNAFSMIVLLGGSQT